MQSISTIWQNSGSKPRGKFVKTVFQDVAKLEKKYQTWNQRVSIKKDAIKKQMIFRIIRRSH